MPYRKVSLLETLYAIREVARTREEIVIAEGLVTRAFYSNGRTFISQAPFHHPGYIQILIDHGVLKLYTATELSKEGVNTDRWEKLANKKIYELVNAGKLGDLIGYIERQPERTIVLGKK